MDKEEDIIMVRRKEIGDFLSKMRQERGFSKYMIEKKTGLRMELIKSIENGSSAYTIDSLLKYASGLEIDLILVDKQDR